MKEMSTNILVSGPGPILVHAAHFFQLQNLLDDERFFAFCQDNPDLRIERTSKGDIIIMPPTGAETGSRNFELIGNFWAWVKKDGSGKGFDSSTGFILPNGATRSPDLAWIRKERWDALPKEQRRKFPSLCPDFVVELVSESDTLPLVQDKMAEYMANGAQLGWLLDPFKRKVHIYRANAAVEVLDNPQTVSGEPLLAGFVLDVAPLWEEA